MLGGLSKYHWVWIIALSLQKIFSCFSFSLRIASKQLLKRVNSILVSFWSRTEWRLRYGVADCNPAIVWQYQRTNWRMILSSMNSPLSCVQLTTLTRFRWTIWDNRTFSHDKGSMKYPFQLRLSLNYWGYCDINPLVGESLNIYLTIDAQILEF